MYEWMNVYVCMYALTRPRTDYPLNQRQPDSNHRTPTSKNPGDAARPCVLDALHVKPNRMFKPNPKNRTDPA